MFVPVDRRSENFDDIPKSYNGLFEYINDHKQEIIKDWSLLTEILNILDDLLKEATNMSDLHKDTKIILETIKLQKDTLIKEVRNEVTFSKVIDMVNEDLLDDFFTRVKMNSQQMSFVDSLDFNFSRSIKNEKRSKRTFDKASGAASEPEKLLMAETTSELNSEIQKIREIVEKKGQVEFYNLIFDPYSFSKTVYNAFNLALALRTQVVSLKSNNNVLFAVPYENYCSQLDHSVFEITMEEYEKMKGKFRKRDK